jgi:hypothetical protein
LWFDPSLAELFITSTLLHLGEDINLLVMSLARKELQRLQKEAKELSIQFVGDSRMNHLEERGNDMIQARSNTDFDVKSAPI